MVRSSTSFPARCRGLLRGKLMRRPFLMGGLASLATGSSRLLGGKFMGRPFLVRRLASFAGDLPLFFFFHGAETTVAFACHASVLSKQGGKDVVRTKSQAQTHQLPFTDMRRTSCIKVCKNDARLSNRLKTGMGRVICRLASPFLHA